MVDRIIVVGARVIGAATALALQQDGHKVTLIDRNSPCSGTSSGNAGAIVNGSCVPSAMPGALFNAIRLLRQINSPLSIRPSYFHKISPWLLRFVLQSRTSRVSENARNLFALTHLTVESWRRLLASTQLNSIFKERGWLKVYELSKSFDATLNSRRLMDQLGTPYQLLPASDIQDIEPNLAPIFKHGFY